MFVINISTYLQLLLLYLFPFRHIPLDLGLAAHACPKRPDLGCKMVTIKFCMFKDVYCMLWAMIAFFFIKIVFVAYILAKILDMFAFDNLAVSQN